MADRWDLLVASFSRSLRAANKAERTVEVYTEAVSRLHDHLVGQGVHEVEEITRAHMEGFVIAQLAHLAPATVSVRYRGLQQWFKWLLTEEQISADPMQHMSPPALPERMVPVLSDEELGRLFAACKGKGFTERRDEALMRVFHDTGCRRGEVVGMRTDKIDLNDRVAVVIGKGDKERPVFFGVKTTAALDRYLLARARHPQADLLDLWLGDRGRGPLTAAGLRQVFRRRGALAGLDGLHPHQLRHTWASAWLSGGGGETDLMSMAGWRSRAMLQRYGASAAQARAQEAHRRLGLGDRI